jgi:hypothetical protein
MTGGLGAWASGGLPIRNGTRAASFATMCLGDPGAARVQRRVKAFPPGIAEQHGSVRNLR